MDSPAATVFCDFDGTVTSIDTFDLVADAVAPERWAELKRQLFGFEINLREGMARLAEVLQPEDLEAMVQRMGALVERWDPDVDNAAAFSTGNDQEKAQGEWQWELE